MLDTIKIMSATGGIGEIDARDDAVVQQQRVAGDGLGAAAAFDLDRCEPASPLGGEPGDTTDEA